MDLYIVYCGALFDHGIPMRDYIRKGFEKSAQVMRILLAEHHEKLYTDKAKKKFEEQMSWMWKKKNTELLQMMILLFLL